MLTVEERFVIKELHRQGKTVSAIARETGHDRKTVRKVIAGELMVGKQTRETERKYHKIAPYEEYLKQRMAEGVYNTRKLYAELCELGYPGGLTQVIEYLQPFRPAKPSPATVRFETEPGQQAQVDWASFGQMECEGRQRRLYAFVMTLCWSRMMYLEFTLSADTGWFLRCHQHAFEYFGGVPREVLHDNLKSAVLERDSEGRIHWNPRYLDFALQFGFNPLAHRPYRPQTKGKVERGVGYVRTSFWPGLHATDVDDINSQALNWLNRVANCRVHGTTGEIPFHRWPAEGLQPLPTQRFDTSILTYRRSGKDCLLSYEGNRYSVPAHVARQTLLVKETEDRQVLIFDPYGQLVATHRLLSGYSRLSMIPEHYAGLSGAAAKPAPLSSPFVRTSPQVEARDLAVYAALLEENGHD